MTQLDVKLASLIVHLIEFQTSGHEIDLIAVQSIARDDDVRQHLQTMKDAGLLPVPRYPEVYDTLGLE